MKDYRGSVQQFVTRTCALGLLSAFQISKFSFWKPICKSSITFKESARSVQFINAKIYNNLLKLMKSYSWKNLEALFSGAQACAYHYTIISWQPEILVAYFLELLNRRLNVLSGSLVQGFLSGSIQRYVKGRNSEKVNQYRIGNLHEVTYLLVELPQKDTWIGYIWSHVYSFSFR